MRLLAPAKINLHLRVGPVDGTGYHPLVTWMCFVGLFDTLTIESTASGKISLDCDDPSLACDDKNLVFRAASALKQSQTAASEQREDPHPSSARIFLEKRIPIGAGLGGGSSDAARTLLGLNRIWGLNIPIDRLSSIAATLGSDVPFFLHGPSSVCTGRGQFVRPIQRPRPRWVLLILPKFGLSTPAVYRRFDDLGSGRTQAIASEPPWQQWADLSAGPLLAGLQNDLEPAAFDLCPKLGELRGKMEDSIGRPVRMSGSGSSLFSLFDDEAEALRAESRIRDGEDSRVLVTELAANIKDDLTA